MKSVIVLLIVGLAVTVDALCPDLCLNVANNFICTRAYLNAGNQRTFPNHCELNLHNCRNPLNKFYTVLNTEACPTAGPIVCPTQCPVTPAPVCSVLFSNIFNSRTARTFATQCEMIQFNCNNPTTVYVQISGQTCPF